MSNPTTTAGWVAWGPLVGLPAANNVPSKLWSICTAVAQNNVPSGFSNASGFVQECAAMLIVRGLIYFKNTPGDCGTPTPLNLQAAQITQGLGGIASGIAAMAGAALPGIGIAVTAITDIFAHHAQAVQTEQTTLCQVAGVVNQVLAYYDGLVKQGKLSPAEAIAGMQSYFAQVTAQLNAIKKSCDAACVYEAFLNAHSAFVQSYYTAIAPAQSSPVAPGSAPATLENSAPASVIAASAASTAGIGAGGSGGNAPVSTTAQFNPGAYVNRLLLNTGTGATYKVGSNGQLIYLPSNAAVTAAGGVLAESGAYFENLIQLSPEQIGEFPGYSANNPYANPWPGVQPTSNWLLWGLVVGAAVLLIYLFAKGDL